MHLVDWRKSLGLTLAEAAAAFGIADANPSRTLQRFETGERRPSAELAETILRESGGKVTAHDLHEVRLQWEKRNAASARAVQP